MKLEKEYDNSETIYGATDNNLNFVPLTEEEMIAQSIDVLNKYQLEKRSISQQKIEQWTASLIA